MTKILIGRSDIDLDYPVCRPSLDLDFTQEELDPRITFTRGSIGTRVNRNRLIETVDANQPRFDYDPVTGECKGLLIEESRINLVTYSEDFSNSTWDKVRSTISSNAIIAPDGTLTADKLVCPAGIKLDHYVKRVFTGLTLSNYTVSVYAKSGEHTNLAINANIGSYCWISYDLKNGTVSYIENSSIASASIQALPNGWYRCSWISKLQATGLDFSFSTSPISGSYPNYLFPGDGTSGIYLWGAQLEEGAFPTSYIPTTTATVTRTADLASMTGNNFSSWYNQSEGTIYVNNKIPYTPSSVSLYFLIFGINAGNRHSIEQTTANGLTYITQNSGGIQYWSTSGSGVLPANTNRKTTYAYSSSNSKTLLSGTSNQTYTFSVKSTTDVYKSMTTMYIGRFSDSLYFLNGTISRLTYYPRRLKDNQLQYLTQ